MPKRYEREIEEILSRMEESEPQKGFGDRIRPFRRPLRPRGSRTLNFPQISAIELLFVLAIALALIASGLAFFDGAPDIWSGVIGLVALTLFVVALVVGWRDRFRPSTQPRWRGNSVEPNRIRRGPFSALAAQVRIWRLRQQYRRAQERQSEPDD